MIVVGVRNQASWVMASNDGISMIPMLPRVRTAGLELLHV